MNALGSNLGNSITEFLSKMSQQAPAASPPQASEPQDRVELSAEARQAA